jgi:hypothetical protein
MHLGGPSTTVCTLSLLARSRPLTHLFHVDVLSAALDSGVAVSIIVIFFALQFPKNGTVRNSLVCLSAS